MRQMSDDDKMAAILYRHFFGGVFLSFRFFRLFKVHFTITLTLPRSTSPFLNLTVAAEDYKSNLCKTF